MNVLGVILARGGSMGLRGKHLLPLLGRPVLSYTLDHARAARSLTRVVVSSDCQDIRKLAISEGFEAIARPPELATSEASVQDVMLHALETVEAGLSLNDLAQAGATECDSLSRYPGGGQGGGFLASCFESWDSEQRPMPPPQPSPGVPGEGEMPVIAHGHFAYDGITPSPLYPGERAGVRGGSGSCARLRTAPHPNPLPRVRGRGDLSEVPGAFRADAVVVLYGNVPVREAGVIDRAVRLLAESGCDSVRSFCPVGKWHPAWMARLRDDRVLPLHAGSIHRRQDLEPLFLHDGAVVAVSRESMLRGRATPDDPHAFFGVDRRGIETGAGDTVEIDQLRDLYWAEAVLRDRAGENTRMAI